MTTRGVSLVGLRVGFVICVVWMLVMIGPILLGFGEQPWTLPGIAIGFLGVLVVIVLAWRRRH